MGYQHQSYIIEKTPENLFGSGQEAVEVGPEQNFSFSKSGLFKFKLYFPPYDQYPNSKIIIIHLDIILSFHLQKKLGELAKNERGTAIFVQLPEFS